MGPNAASVYSCLSTRCQANFSPPNVRIFRPFWNAFSLCKIGTGIAHFALSCANAGPIRFPTENRRTTLQLALPSRCLRSNLVPVILSGEFELGLSLRQIVERRLFLAQPHIKGSFGVRLQPGEEMAELVLFRAQVGARDAGSGRLAGQPFSDADAGLFELPNLVGVVREQPYTPYPQSL